MTAFVLVAAGLLGLVTGSFLNVVVHRVPRKLSVVRPASRCPVCANPVRPQHNVPVIGWLVLRGRCADCGTGISVRYPAVELLTAGLFVAVTARFGIESDLPAFLYLAAIAVALAAIDIDTYRLPTAIVGPSYAVAGVLLTASAAVTSDWYALVRAGAGMVAVGGFYRLIRALAPHGMGMGDVRLAGLLGLFLGWVSWGSVLVGTFAGFLIGSVVGVALLAGRRVERKSRIPFGPAMLAGALLALFVAGPVVSWYQSAVALST